MLTNANAAFAIDKIVDAARPHARRQAAQTRTTSSSPTCRCATSPSGSSRRGTWSSCGCVLNFAESIETITANLREVQPTLFFAVPRIWEKLHAGILIRANDATWLKRKALGFGIAPRPLDRQGEGRQRRRPHRRRAGCSTPIGFPLVLRALKERIGLRRCRYAASGAAPIAPEVLEFFIGIGVPVFELYGMTENTAVATANFAGPDEARHRRRAVPGHRAPPRPGDRRDPDASTPACSPATGASRTRPAETMTDDGWLMTGDVGEWVDGTHVKIVDRIKHIIITSGGKNISPSEIENSLKTSPYVKEAMVIGDGRKLPHRADRHRVRHRRRLGAAAQPPVHDVPRPLREARGHRADPGRRQRDQREVRLGRADQEVPA